MLNASEVVQMLPFAVNVFTSFFSERVNRSRKKLFAIKYENIFRDKGVKLVERCVNHWKIDARFLGISKPAVMSLKLQTRFGNFVFKRLSLETTPFIYLCTILEHYYHLNIGKDCAITLSFRRCQSSSFRANPSYPESMNRYSLPHPVF